jgi:hypothetical protein
MGEPALLSLGTGISVTHRLPALYQSQPGYATALVSVAQELADML